MSNILAEFKDEFPNVCIVLQVLNSRHTVTNRFVGSFYISDGDLGGIHSVGEPPKIDSALTKLSLEEVTWELRDLTYGPNTNGG